MARLPMIATAGEVRPHCTMRHNLSESRRRYWLETGWVLRALDGFEESAGSALLWSGERMSAVSDGSARPKRRSDRHHFGDFRIGCTAPPSFARVDLDAVGALCCERNGERHQFFVLGRNRSVGHGGFVKCPECLHRVRGIRVQNLQLSQVTHAVQATPPVFV